MRLVLICEEASRWSLVIPQASPTRQQREILIQKESSYPGAITSINQISWLVNGAVRSVGFIMNYAARLIVTQIYGPVAICRRVYPSCDIWIRRLYGTEGCNIRSSVLISPTWSYLLSISQFIGLWKWENGLVKVTTLWLWQLQSAR